MQDDSNAGCTYVTVLHAQDVQSCGRLAWSALRSVSCFVPLALAIVPLHHLTKARG